jgi:hypothetical protein
MIHTNIGAKSSTSRTQESELVPASSGARGSVGQGSLGSIPGGQSLELGLSAAAELNLKPDAKYLL